MPRTSCSHAYEIDSERIEDYNEIAGGLAEPYTIVAAVGLPVGLSRSSHRYLNALIESGLQCGNTVIIVSDRATQWPSVPTEPNSSKILHIDVSESGLAYRIGIPWRVPLSNHIKHQIPPNDDYLLIISVLLRRHLVLKCL